jgi:hypothetical protein
MGRYECAWYLRCFQQSFDDEKPASSRLHAEHMTLARWRALSSTRQISRIPCRQAVETMSQCCLRVWNRRRKKAKYAAGARLGVCAFCSTRRPTRHSSPNTTSTFTVICPPPQSPSPAHVAYAWPTWTRLPRISQTTPQMTSPRTSKAAGRAAWSQRQTTTPSAPANACA